MDHVNRPLLARLALAGMLAALILMFGRPVAAQPQCDDRARVLEHLAKKYNEAPIAVGVTGSGGLIEVLSDARGGSWTIIVTTPNGTSCLLAAGEGWRVLPASKEGSKT